MMSDVRQDSEKYLLVVMSIGIFIFAQVGAQLAQTSSPPRIPTPPPIKS